MHLRTSTPELRNPLEIALYIVLVAFTAGTAIGRTPLPGSLADQPDVYGQTAAAFITFGAAVSAFGLLWWRDRLDAYVIYQLGVGVLSIGCALYAFALYWTGPLAQVALAAGVFAGLTVGCAARWFQINRWWRRERAQAKKVLDSNGGPHA